MDFMDQSFKPEFTFKIEDETDNELTYVLESNTGKIIKRRIKKEDFIDINTKMHIQDEMTTEAMMPNIPGVHI